VTTPRHIRGVLPFKLARRELRGGLKGFRILMACLALGVAAIAIVQSLASSVVAGLDNDGRTILGGDVAIRTFQSTLPNDALDYLASRTAAVSYFTEMRTMARRPDGETSSLAELKAVTDTYPLYGAVELFKGQLLSDALAQRDGIWGAVAEPTILAQLGLATGDRLQLGDTAYEVRARLAREPDRASVEGGFGFAPRVMVHADSLPATGLLQRGSLVQHQYRLRLPEGTSIAGFREQLGKRFPDELWRVRDYRNPAHRVEHMTERLTLFLTLVGLTALLVGGVGVSNAVKTYLEGKIRTIATLKCVGATSDILFYAYSVQVLILACGGIGIGLIIGAAVPWLTTTLVAEYVPIPLQPGVYVGALARAALFGALTTLTFAVWPLARTHAVPPSALFRGAVERRRRAIPRLALGISFASASLLVMLTLLSVENKGFAAWFIVGSILAMVTLRGAAWSVMRLVPHWPRPRHPGIRLAMANLHRPGTLTPDVILSLGIGLTLLVTIALIEANFDKQVNESIPDMAPAFFFMDIQSAQIAEFSRLVQSIPGTDELRQVPYLRGRILEVDGQPAASRLTDEQHGWLIRGDRGLTYSAVQPRDTQLVAGKWWSADYAGPPLLSIHQDVAAAFDVGVGDTITLNVLGRRITGTIANIRYLAWQTLQLNFAIMLSPEPLQGAPHTFIATLSATDEADPNVHRAVTKTFPNVTAVRIKDALETVNRLITRIGAAVRGVASITLIAGTLVLAGAIAAGHQRRVYESVLLKVFGATRADAVKAYLLEYSLLGLLSAAIAALAGSLAAWAVIKWFMEGIDWVFIPSAVVATVLLCTGVTLVLGFIGTWRALGQKPAPLLRNE